MGIKVRNLDHQVIEFTLNKTLSATLNAGIAKPFFSGFISDISAVIQTPGSGATNTVLDVNLNGTTIFSAATKITLASTTGVASYSDLTATPTQVTYGSILSLDVDSVSTNPLNAIVQIVISKQPLNTADNNTDLNFAR